MLALLVTIIVLGFSSLAASKSSSIDEFNKKQLILAERGANSIKLYLDSLTRETNAIAEAAIIKVFLKMRVVSNYRAD